MAISLNTLKPIILTLIFLMFVSMFGGLTALLPTETAKAQWVVTDPIGTAVSWAIKALKWVGDKVLHGLEIAAKWAVARAQDTWNWLRQNALLILYAAGLKLAAKFLLQQVQKLIANNKIQSYLYYADFLVRSVYAIEQINKYLPPECANITTATSTGNNYSSDREKCTHARRDQMVLLSLISDGQQLYGRLNPNTPAYEGIKQATLFNPKCQTYNVSPQDPEYYVKLLESRSPDCMPQFVAAGFRDRALQDLAAAQQAADAELAQSGGFQSGRQCGTVATRDIFRTEITGTETQTVPIEDYSNFDENGNPAVTNQQVTVNRLQTVNAGQAVDIVPTVSSVFCSLISYPAGQLNTVVNGMIDRIINISTDPEGKNQSSAQLRSFVSDTMSTMLYKLMNTCTGQTTVQFIQRNLRLASNCERPDTSLADEVPGGIDANGIDTSAETGDAALPSGRTQQQLDDFWTDLCSERLPLIYTLKNNIDKTTFPTRFAEISSIQVKQNNRIDLGSNRPNPDGSYFLVGNSETGNPQGTTRTGNPPGYVRATVGNVFDAPGRAGDPTSVYKNSFPQYTHTHLDIRKWLITGERPAASQPNPNTTVYVSGPVPTIEDIFNTRTTFFSHNDDTGHFNVYNYIWQILDSVDKVDPTLGHGGLGSAGDSFGDWMQFGRRYVLAQAGFPNGKDINDASNWIPKNWPYFVDESGKGFQFTLNGTIYIPTPYAYPTPSTGGTGDDNDADDDGILDDEDADTDTNLDSNGDPINNNNGGGGEEDNTEPVSSKNQNIFSQLFGPEIAHAGSIVVKDLYRTQRVDVTLAQATAGDPGKGKIYLVTPSSTSKPAQLQNVRIYDIDGELIAMWPDVALDLSQRRMWKLNKNVSVTINNGAPVVNYNSLKVSSDGTASVIEYTDARTGQTKVLGATELTPQKPCSSQPYGPPIDLPDLESKVNFSKEMAPAMWKWIGQVKFLTNAVGASGR